MRCNSQILIRQHCQSDHSSSYLIVRNWLAWELPAQESKCAILIPSCGCLTCLRHNNCIPTKSLIQVAYGIVLELVVHSQDRVMHIWATTSANTELALHCTLHELTQTAKRLPTNIHHHCASQKGLLNTADLRLPMAGLFESAVSFSAGVVFLRPPLGPCLYVRPLLSRRSRLSSACRARLRNVATSLQSSFKLIAEKLQTHADDILITFIMSGHDRIWTVASYC